MAITKKTEEKVKTGIVSTETNIKTLLKEATGTVVVLSRVETEKKLKALVKLKKARLEELVAIEILDKKQLEELKGINAEFRDNRYALQNIDKHNISALNLAKKNNGAMIDELKLIIDPSETMAYNKLKQQEKILEDLKAEEERIEQERIEGIQNKINDAGLFFEKELEQARKTNDWVKFDEYYKTFEEGLESLEELEFEGTEVLEKYEGLKNKIIDLAKQAEAQFKKDRELNEKEMTLRAEKDKAEEEKKRMFEMFSIGFMFNGIEFFKEEIKFSQSEVNSKTEKEFLSFIKIYKDEAEEIKKFNALELEAKELKLEWKINEGEDRISVLTNLIENDKKEKTEAEKLAEKKKTEANAEELKEVGKIVCTSILLHLQEMEEAVAPYELIREEAKKHTTSFFKNIKKEFDLLKELLNQDEEK